MAKKSSTVYLEGMFWDMITDYQSDKGLSSRNDALQLILQEWSILRKIDLGNINIHVSGESKIESQPIDDKEPEMNDTKKDEEKVDPRITQSIFAMSGTMKDE